MLRRHCFNKHSIEGGCYKSSISLEDDFWVELKRISKKEKLKIAYLISLISWIEMSAEKPMPNLSSAIRVFILKYVKNEQKGGVDVLVDRNTRS